MLVSNGSEIIRVQCAFIDTPEIEKMTEFIGNQRGYTDAFHLPEYAEDNGNADSLSSDPNERDELFEEAARIIVASQQGSTSLLQRKLKLGYNRAGRLIDQLEAAGIVGPFEGSKAREVKIKDEVALEQILNRNKI
jgi:DNA segregation ATPase FtsK/SpoIIIE, S-DNA-T family